MGDDLRVNRLPWFLTGADGYLGGRIKALGAARGQEVAAVTRSDVDLRDSEAVTRLVPSDQVILHCAASVPKTADDYADEVIAEDGVAMVRSLLATRPARLIFASSMTVYSKSRSPVREEDAPAPGSGYSGGKRRAELLIENSGVPATILRLPGLFGPPRTDGFLYNAACAIAEGKDFQINARPSIWAALHVDDAAESMVRAADLTGPTQTLNIGYPGRFSLNRALDQLRSGVVSDEGHGFEMDLTRMRETIGELPYSWGERLDELLKEVADA